MRSTKGTDIKDRYSLQGSDEDMPVIEMSRTEDPEVRADTQPDTVDTAEDGFSSEVR